MAARAGLLEWRHGHEALVIAAVVAARAGAGDAFCRILLRDFRKVLTEVPGMIVDDRRALLERIALELRMLAVETVELDDVAGLASFVRNRNQIGFGALVLLMACGARDPLLLHAICRKRPALDAGRERRVHGGSGLDQPLRALLQHIGRCPMRIECRIRHLMAGETGLAVGVRIAGDEPLRPTEFSVTAASRVARAAILDRTVRADERARHEELSVLGEEEHCSDADGRRDSRKNSQAVA